MTSKILNRLKQSVERLILIPSSGGRFEIEVDGELIYSKLSTGSFPDEGSILEQIEGRA